MTLTEAITRLETATAASIAATEELGRAATAALKLAGVTARQTEAKLADDDEWARMPYGTARCIVSNWSRSTLVRKATTSKVPVPDKIRTKTIGSARFYSLADVRRLLQGA